MVEGTDREGELSQDQQYDVAIAGASIAGCTAATFLARRGARVALVERRPDPGAWKTMCTHFIQASATPTLERLGLVDQIEAAGGVRNGLDIWSRYGWVRPELDGDFEYPRYGYDIRREKLDPMIRTLAAETPGVDLILGETVTGLVQNGRPRGLRTSDRNRNEREIRARVVVGADGRDSEIARMANVRARVLPHGRFGYFAYYSGLPLASDERTLFWFLDPDIAYAFPNDGGLTLLAVFLTKDHQSWFKRDLEANFENYFRGLPRAPDLSCGTRESKILGRLELPNTLRSAARPGLAFVGDAAMSADPVWGVGCGWALQSGEWLAEEVGDALAAGAPDDAVDDALGRYRKRHRRMLLGHYLLTSDYSSGRRFNPLERLIFAGGARDNRAATGFFSFGSRSVRANDPAFARTVAASVRAIVMNPAPATGELTGPHAEGPPPPASVRRSRIDVNGLSTPVSSVGAADSSEAVVFLHGNPGSSRDWDDLLSRVAPFARGVAPDMPGFGRAERPADFQYDVEGYARFFEALLEGLGIERAHLVLHDFGGPWGLEWATWHPDRVGSVTLINTGVLIDYRWHYLARIWRTPGLGQLFQKTTTRSGLRTALKHGNPRGLPRAFVDRMFDSVDAGTDRAILSLYRAADDPAGVSRRHADALRPHEIPALVVWGAHDPYIPVALAERQREAFPDAQVVILDESGHWPFADDPDSVGRAVEPFLHERVAPARELSVT
jgi:flavin-dependent dehydrogenase/pimeloyl-ACP methyl ester carboxylesterase